jgi:Protein of unknown function (DUF2799)
VRNLESRPLVSKLALGVVVIPWVLSACSGMSAKECSVMDWRSVGYEDGVAGMSGSHIAAYRQACAKHGVSTDFAAYQTGRESGLREYCQPSNGFRVGSQGREYRGVCPAALEPGFLGPYESGQRLFTLESRADNAARALANKREERNRIEQDIVGNAAVVVGGESTPENRAHAMIETSQLAERKGRIDIEISQLEQALPAYQQAVQEYRATLAANR